MEAEQAGAGARHFVHFARPSLQTVYYLSILPSGGVPGETPVTREEALHLAEHWVAAWNAHDLDAILAHYDESVELTSPVVAQLLGRPDGKVVGKASLRAYFQRGLEAFPNLHFRLEDVLCGVSSVLLYYTNQRGTRTGEFMELSAEGKVLRVVANYNVAPAGKGRQ